MTLSFWFSNEWRSKPYLFVNSRINKNTCTIFISIDNSERSGTEEIKRKKSSFAHGILGAVEWNWKRKFRFHEISVFAKIKILWKRRFFIDWIFFRLLAWNIKKYDGLRIGRWFRFKMVSNRLRLKFGIFLLWVWAGANGNFLWRLNNVTWITNLFAGSCSYAQEQWDATYFLK